MWRLLPWLLLRSAGWAAAGISQLHLFQPAVVVPQTLLLHLGGDAGVASTRLPLVIAGICRLGQRSRVQAQLMVLLSAGRGLLHVLWAWGLGPRASGSTSDTGGGTASIRRCQPSRSCQPRQQRDPTAQHCEQYESSNRRRLPCHGKGVAGQGFFRCHWSLRCGTKGRESLSLNCQRQKFLGEHLLPDSVRSEPTHKGWDGGGQPPGTVSAVLRDQQVVLRRSNRR